MKTNVFLCVTEYHVLLSILLATEEFQSIDYDNQIILCNCGRFNVKERYNLDKYSNISFRIYEQKEIESIGFLEDILTICNGNIFLYNLNNPHFLYLFYYLKKEKKAKTSVVQEGLASYNKRHYSFRQRLGVIKNDYIVMRRSGIKDIGFYWYCFGIPGRFGKVCDYYDKVVDSTLVDEFYLSLPEYAKYGQEKVKALPPLTKTSLASANSFFNYNQPLNLNENDIVFIDQRIDGSFEFVRELSETFKGSNIYVKLHPRTNDSWISKYESTPRVTVLKSMRGIPIELMLQNLYHNIIVTPFSSALLIDNPVCRYYFAYKWFVCKGYDIENNVIYTPGDHIRIVDSVDKIEMY